MIECSHCSLVLGAQSNDSPNIKDILGPTTSMTLGCSFTANFSCAYMNNCPGACVREFPPEGLREVKHIEYRNSLGFKVNKI